MPAAGGVLTHAQIKALLAHRAPFLFLSRASHNVPGRSVVAVLEPTPGTPFPPTRAALLEALGQAGALVLRQSPAYAHERLPAFAAMRSVAWRPWPAAGAPREVAVEARLQRGARSRYGVLLARAVVAGSDRPVCEAELVFSFLRDAAAGAGARAG